MRSAVACAGVFDEVGGGGGGGGGVVSCSTWALVVVVVVAHKKNTLAEMVVETAVVKMGVYSEVVVVVEWEVVSYEEVATPFLN